MSQSIFPRSNLRLGQSSGHICLYDSTFVWTQVLHETRKNFKNRHLYGTRTQVEYLSSYGTWTHLEIHLSSMNSVHSWDSNLLWRTNHLNSTLYKHLNWDVYGQGLFSNTWLGFNIQRDCINQSLGDHIRQFLYHHNMLHTRPIDSQFKRVHAYNTHRGNSVSKNHHLNHVHTLNLSYLFIHLVINLDSPHFSS